MAETGGHVILRGLHLLDPSITRVSYWSNSRKSLGLRDNTASAERPLEYKNQIKADQWPCSS